MQGRPEGIAKARAIVNDIMQRVMTTGWGRGAPGAWAPGPDQIEDFMVVPGCRTGAVIGRGGETIRMMTQTSGARIEADRAQPSHAGAEKTFRLRGTRQQVDYAKRLINEKVAELEFGGDRFDSSAEDPSQQLTRCVQQGRIVYNRHFFLAADVDIPTPWIRARYHAHAPVLSRLSNTAGV